MRVNELGGIWCTTAMAKQIAEKIAGEHGTNYDDWHIKLVRTAYDQGYLDSLMNSDDLNEEDEDH